MSLTILSRSKTAVYKLFTNLALIVSLLPALTRYSSYSSPRLHHNAHSHLQTTPTQRPPISTAISCCIVSTVQDHRLVPYCSSSYQHRIAVPLSSTTSLTPRPCMPFARPSAVEHLFRFIVVSPFHTVIPSLLPACTKHHPQALHRCSFATM